MRPSLLLASLSAFAGAALAQANVVPGLDGRLSLVDNLTYYGSRSAQGGTEVGMAMLNTMCNPGSVVIPWQAAMQPNHPKFGFIIARVSPSGDRIEQISDWSYCKHAFTSVNVNGACGSCQNPGTGSLMGLNCSDTYGAGNNADRHWLGPPSEIDPWLGTWNPVGSYFDQGDPNVGPPQNTDGIRSPSYSGPDQVKNRVTVRQTDLQVAGASYFYGIHLIHQGEAVANRGDNLASRGFNPIQGGSSWSFPNNSIGQVHGTILQHWPGASIDVGQNGNDDGRFFVAVKVTPLGGGNYHYEYAVHNVDNSRAGATFRVPVDANGTASNFTFGDIDTNALNDWVGARVGNEVVWNAPAGNPLEWNTIYNFGFDCDVAPSFGQVILDEARVGAGALSVVVNAEVPSGIPAARVTTVGSSAGCGTCDSMFYESFGSTSFDLSGSSMTMTLQNGEYSVGSGTGTFAPAAGATLALSDDSQVTITLPFALPYPGGTTNTLVVCSNGFVSVAGNGTPFTPSSSQFLGFSSCWAALWHDLNPAAGGAVRYESTPTAARITWDNVRYFGTTIGATFQYQFLPNGTVHVLWQSVPPGGNGFLVGWNPGGNPSDPGSRDLSATLPQGFGLCAAPFTGLLLSASNRPVFGTTINLVTTGVPPSAGFGVILKSLQQYVPPLDLSVYGMPGCEGHPQNGVGRLVTPIGTSFSEAFTVPNHPSFTGLDIVVQTFAHSPPLTPLGIVASNGVVLTLGPQ